MGSKPGGDPAVHFTKGTHTQSQMSEGPGADTLFHSDLDYLQIKEKVLVDTWTRASESRGVVSYVPTIPARVRSLLAQGYLFSVITKGNRYVASPDPRYGASPVDPMRGDIQYSNVNTATLGVYVQDSAFNIIIRHMPSASTSFGHPFSRMPPYNTGTLDGGKSVRSGSLYLEAKKASPGVYSASASGSFLAASDAFDPDDVLYSSDTFSTSQSGLAYVTSDIKITEADVGNNRGRNHLIPNWRVSTTLGLSLPGKLYYEEVDQGRNPWDMYSRNAIPRGYMFIFYNIKKSGEKYEVLKPDPTTSGGIKVDREDIKVGSTFSLRNSELLTEIPVSHEIAKISSGGVLRYEFHSGQAGTLGYDPLFKFINNIYYIGRKWTEELATLTHNAGLTVWVRYGKIQAWRVRVNSKEVALWAIKPESMLDKPGMQLTNDSLIFSDGARTVDIVTPASGLLKLTGRELNLTVPSSSFNYADARYQAEFVPSRFGNPFQQDGGYSPGYYKKEEVVGSVSLPPDIGESNQLILMLEPTAPKGTLSVRRGGTCSVQIHYNRTNHPAPLITVTRRQGVDVTSVGATLFSGRFTATDFTTQKYSYVSNSGNNRMQGVALEYYLRMNWSSKQLEVVRRLVMANENWKFIVPRGDGAIRGQVYGYGDKEVIYQMPEIVINAFVTSASKYAT